MGRAGALGAVVCGLAVAGLALDILVRPVRRASAALVWAGEKPLRVAVQDTAPAAPGGVRTLAADFAWLRMQQKWEHRDGPGTAFYVRLATDLDPGMVWFWKNGARILAFDIPVWRLSSAAVGRAVPPSIERRVRREQAAMALRLLERAMHHHPVSAELWMERAAIELFALGEIGAAAESYRRAWELPGGPPIAARLRGVLLMRLGLRTEALAWYRRLLPQLLRDDDLEGAAMARARIRELEAEMGGRAAP